MHLGLIVIAVYIGVNAYALKKKDKKLLIAAVVGLGLFIFLLAPIRNISEQGSFIMVKNKFGGKVTLQKTGAKKSWVYMMVGQVNRPMGISGYSIKIPVLPIAAVEDLNKQYGDFRKCGTLHKAAIMNQIVELRLVGTDKKVINQIEKAFENSIGNHQDIFLNVDAIPLQLVENRMMNSRGGDLSPATYQENLWVQNLSFFSKQVR